MSNAHDNERQFLAVYDEHNDSLFRFCLLKVRNREAALDITQETFMKTWVYMNSGKTIDNLRAFMFRVARNLIIDRSRRITMQSLELLLEDGKEFGIDNTSRQRNRIDGERLIGHLDRLEEGDRDLLIMRFVEDLDLDDIAYVLRQKKSTISVRLHRAIKRAQALYPEEDND